MPHPEDLPVRDVGCRFSENLTPTGSYAVFSTRICSARTSGVTPPGPVVVEDMDEMNWDLDAALP